MTKAEATARAAELNDSDQDDGRWLVQERSPGDWRAVCVRVPGLSSRGPLKASVESRPKPEEPPDPRPSIIQNIPPYGAGI